MKRLIVDYLKRRKWWILGFGGYFIANYAQFLVTEDGRRSPPGDLNFMLFAVVVVGISFSAGDMKFGVSRIARTLPLSAREVAVASWLTSVATVSLTVVIVLALTLCVSFGFGRTSVADFQLVPLALAWGAAISGTVYLCWMRFRKLFIPLYVGLAALAVFYGPPIRAPWTGLQVPQVLTLLLGLTLSGYSFLLASRVGGRNLMIDQPQLSTSQLRGARPKGAGGGSMPSVLPSRRVGMASPWLQAFGFSCLGLLVLILLAIGFLMTVRSRSGDPSSLAAFFAERVSIVRIAIILSFVSIVFSTIICGRWMFSLRAFRALPLSASRLAWLLMAFPLVASLPCCLAMLAAAIVIQSEAMLLAALILLTGAGCASVFCALAIRVSLPPRVFGATGVAGFGALQVFLISSVSRGSASAELIVDSTLVKASLFLAALVLMGIAFFLFRQTIASGSRPYRPVPMIAERMPGGR